jgi:hypothetical protein
MCVQLDPPCLSSELSHCHVGTANDCERVAPANVALNDPPVDAALTLVARVIEVRHSVLLCTTIHNDDDGGSGDSDGGVREIGWCESGCGGGGDGGVGGGGWGYLLAMCVVH